MNLDWGVGVPVNVVSDHGLSAWDKVSPGGQLARWKVRFDKSIKTFGYFLCITIHGM